MGADGSGIFETLEYSSVGSFVGGSLWAYPLFLSLHVIGLAVVVGIFAMRDLTILGAFPGLRPSSFLPLIRFAWIGFVVNATSGVLLFIGQATTFISNVPFLIKILVISFAALLAAVIQRELHTGLETDDTTPPDLPLRVMAVFSLIAWFIVIVAGRMIAYF